MYNDMMAQRQAEEKTEKNRAEEEKKRRWKKVVEETQSKYEYNMFVLISQFIP